MSEGPIQIDRRRDFRLPRIDELRKRQEDARALPMVGRHLVIGGPGTGKSVVALLRARRCAEMRTPYVFLVYNRLLHRASGQLMPRLRMSTWEHWFPRAFQEVTRKECPKREAAPGKSYQPIDWDGVNQLLETHDPTPNPQIVIIDEGQDMPPVFYRALIRLGFENFFVVADQNQQIIDGKNSSRADIEDELSIDSENVVELLENFRNSHPTARLAREFYTGDPATPAPELPPVARLSKVPLLYEYDDSRFAVLIRKILKFSDLNPNQLIGIIAPNNEVREAYVKALGTIEVPLDYPRPVIQTYVSGSDANLRFDEGGIMVINQQSCKGLEFDFVFIADINRFLYNVSDPDDAKRRFYVMIARAKGRVVLLKQSGRHCPINPIIPTNSNILERHAP